MSRILVISDIHSNFPALEAVLSNAHRQGPFDLKVCLGDIVGYGPFPNQSVERIESENFSTIEGNHDYAVRTGNTEGFNGMARLSANHNNSALSDDNMDYLNCLSNLPKIFGPVAAVHGSFAGTSSGYPTDRYDGIYIREDIDAARAIFAMNNDDKYQGISLGIVGHTHRPMFASMEFGKKEELTRYEDPFKQPSVTFSRVLSPRRIALFNPGSVGQPRDGNPNAAYSIIDVGRHEITIQFIRVRYDINKTQSEMRKIGHTEYSGFVPELIERLSLGM